MQIARSIAVSRCMYIYIYIYIYYTCTNFRESYKSFRELVAYNCLIRARARAKFSTGAGDISLGFSACCIMICATFAGVKESILFLYRYIFIVFLSV